MFLLNKFFLLGVGGFAVAGTGTGLGIYYGVQSTKNQKGDEAKVKGEAKKPEAAKPSGGASSADSSSQPGPGGK